MKELTQRIEALEEEIRELKSVLKPLIEEERRKALFNALWHEKNRQKTECGLTAGGDC